MKQHRNMFSQITILVRKWQCHRLFLLVEHWASCFVSGEQHVLREWSNSDFYEVGYCQFSRYLSCLCQPGWFLIPEAFVICLPVASRGFAMLLSSCFGGQPSLAHGGCIGQPCHFSKCHSSTRPRIMSFQVNYGQEFIRF